MKFGFSVSKVESGLARAFFISPDENIDSLPCQADMRLCDKIKSFRYNLSTMVVEKDPAEAIKQAVDDVTGDSVSIGDHNPENLDAFMQGNKEQEYHVDVQDLESNTHGKVVVELIKRGNNWKAEVVEKVRI